MRRILTESFISFLGLGVQEPLTSLGILVKEGADDMDVEPMGLLVPGGVMVTAPVNHASGPRAGGRDALRLTSIVAPSAAALRTSVASLGAGEPCSRR